MEYSVGVWGMVFGDDVNVIVSVIVFVDFLDDVEELWIYFGVFVGMLIL